MSGENDRQLLDHHRERLEVASAISPEVIAARGYYSVSSRDELKGLRFPADVGRCLPGLAIPLFGLAHHDPGATAHVTGLVLRPDTAYERKDGSTAKYLMPNGAQQVLDVHPAQLELIDDTAVPLIVTEGVIKGDAAVSAGLAAIALGGVDAWMRSGAALPAWKLVPLSGRRVLIVYDSDVTSKPEAQVALRLLLRYLVEERKAQVDVVQLLPGDHGSKTGLDDFLASRNGTPHPVLDLNKHVVRLEAIPDQPPAAPELPARVTGAEVLDRVHEFICRYVYFSNEAGGWAATLWVAHTHLIDQFDVCAYQAVRSAVPECGKSLLLEIESLLVRRGEYLVEPSDASVFRLMSEHPAPALLVDELDQTLKAASDRGSLIGLFNAGYRRGAYVVRFDVDKGKIGRFPVFGPKAYASVDNVLPDTTSSRTIPIVLKRKPRGAKVARWRTRRCVPAALELRDLLAGWAASTGDAVAELEFDEVPDFLTDRGGDIWEPLWATATVAGGHWPERALKAARTVSRRGQEKLGEAQELLRDMRTVFDALKFPPVIKSGDMAAALNKLEDSRWGDMRQGNGVSTHKLAALMAKFDVRTDRRELEGRTVRGWCLDLIQPLWEVNLPGVADEYDDAPDSGVSPPTPNQSVGVSVLADSPLNQAKTPPDTSVAHEALPEQSVGIEIPAKRHLPDTPTLQLAREAENANLRVVDEPAEEPVVIVAEPVAVAVDEATPLVAEHTQVLPLGEGPELRVEFVPPEQPDRRELLRAFLNASQRAGATLGVDLEATGKDPHADGFEVRLWSISDGETAFVVDHRDERSRELVRELLRRYKHPLALHNGYSYDLPVIVRELGLDVATVSRRARELRLLDTMILARLADPDAKRIGLKETSTRAFGDGAAGPARLLQQAFRSLNANWRTVPSAHPAFWAYCGADAALTLRLDKLLRAEAGTPTLLELEHRVAAICLRAGLRGLQVDPWAASELEHRLGAESERLEQALLGQGISKIATDTGRASIVQALEREGLQLAHGRLDRAALGPLAAVGSVVARDVLALRTVSKFRALYSRMFERALECDGRLHGYARSLAATTGRMAISGVPLQTAPKQIELAGNLDQAGRLAIRDVLVADAGQVIASCDFTAMELRLAAGLSGDPGLRAVVEAGDPHTAIACSLFDTKAPTAEQRAVAKTTNFGAMYGMGAETLSVRLGVSEEQASAFLEAWWRRFPMLERYANTLSDHDRTPWGRRLPVDAPRHARLNHRVQAAGRDVFCAGLLRLEDAGLVDHLALPLHDEYVLSLPEDGALELVARAASIVSSELGGVPLPVEANVGGRSWGSAK